MTGHGRVANQNNRSLQRKKATSYFHDTRIQPKSTLSSNASEKPRVKSPGQAEKLLSKNKTQIMFELAFTVIVLLVLGGYLLLRIYKAFIT